MRRPPPPVRAAPAPPIRWERARLARLRVRRCSAPIAPAREQAGEKAAAGDAPPRRLPAPVRRGAARPFPLRRSAATGVSAAPPFLPPDCTVPICTATGRRLIAGPRPRKCPRCRSRIRSACLRSMPSRSAARCMSISRKVRPIRKLLASAATFFASLASRWVATIPASPRLRPRHIRLVIAASDIRRVSSAISPPQRARTSALRRPPPAPDTNARAGHRTAR